VLTYLFPRDVTTLNQRAAEAAESRIWAGIHYRSDIDGGLALGRFVAQLVIDRAKEDGSQVESVVTGMILSPASVQAGESFIATISGMNLSGNAYLDIRYRRPDSTAEQVSLNWQQGILARHTVPMGTTTGTWTVTGVRSHQVVNDQSGSFASVSATLIVSPAP
jgi:hypothetical protein